MAQIVLFFSHPLTANFLVAGIPAAARALHQVSLASRDGSVPAENCVISVAGGWVPSAWCREEFNRLAPDLKVEIVDWNDLGALRSGAIRGEDLVTASGARAALSTHFNSGSELHNRKSVDATLAELKQASDAILLATGKPGDGIVSRYINRPISRAISRVLLRFPGVVPMHATFAAAALGIAMAICLFAGGPAGLLAGAVLFQAASIVDGVDGEIARATFRSSNTGAMLDSLTDAATNLAFIAGLTFNLWQQGHDHPAMAGAAGLTMLAIGMFLIGRRARAKGGAFTFDGVKDHFRKRPSRLMQWLTWISMRDFYAAASTALILVGFAPHALIAFSIATAGWFAVTLSVLFGKSRQSAQA